MDIETLNAIVDLARKSDEIQIVKESRDGSVVYRDAPGSLDKFYIPADPRNHAACDIETVVAFAGDSSEIWYSRSAIVCLINRDDRRDRVTCKMNLSPQIQALQNLEATGKAYTQAEMILALRTTFAGCLRDEASAQLLPSIRAVKFTRNEEGASVVDVGKSSIGKRLTQEVTGSGMPIPETVEMTVPVFAGVVEFNASIKCAIDVDAASGKFRIIPLPLEIESAIISGENCTAVTIETEMKEQEKKTPLYCGTV